MTSAAPDRAAPVAQPRLFASLTPAHQNRSRVCYRYRLTPGLPALAPHALERVAQEISGVTQVRLNAAARSLALHFDPARTRPEAIAQALLRLPAVAATGACGSAIAADDGHAEKAGLHL